MLRGGRCCKRSDLLREVWQMSPDTGTNVVDVYINYLRKKLGAVGGEGDGKASVIETVRGEGYQMSGVKIVPEALYAADAEYSDDSALVGGVRDEVSRGDGGRDIGDGGGAARSLPAL